jgi:hypothetical protein
MSLPPRSEDEEVASIPDRIPEPRIDAEYTDERPKSGEYARRYWEQMDSLFFRTIGHAENAFRTNVYTNIILVTVGLVIIGYSIFYSWNYGLDLAATAFSGIGVLSFVVTFFSTPQEKIQKTVGDLSQIQMFYRTYCMLWENIGDYQRINQQSITIDDLEKINTQLENHTIKITEKIEALIGNKSQE